MTFGIRPGRYRGTVRPIGWRDAFGFFAIVALALGITGALMLARYLATGSI